MADIVDSPREALPPLRMDKCGMRKVGGGRGEGGRAEAGIYNEYYIKLKDSVTSYLARSQPLLKFVIPEVL